MSERSIHDNNVYSYCILCESRRIVLHTEYSFPRDGATEYIDITFCDVMAHHFESVSQGNCLFGIDEVPVEKLIGDWAELFTRQKPFGWPAIQYNDPQELVTKLKQNGIKGYDISSSYGLTGWVLAGSMDVTERSAKFDTLIEMNDGKANRKN